MAIKLTGKTPIFGGSTGGLLSKADVEEKYAITWNSPKEQVFEMTTGGSATMVAGDNILYMARKEQCLAFATQFRKLKITNYKVYRILPKGEITLLHPNDGVFPEKVNAGREAQNSVDRNIGSNPEPAKLKFTGKRTID